MASKLQPALIFLVVNGVDVPSLHHGSHPIIGVDVCLLFISSFNKIKYI